MADAAALIRRHLAHLLASQRDPAGIDRLLAASRLSRDADGSLPTLDAAGGHEGPTAHSTTPVYHYHVNEQTSTARTSVGEKQWFLTKGAYHGAPGTCTGCM